VGNPVDQMFVTDSGRYAVSIERPESNNGSGIDSYQDAR